MLGRSRSLTVDGSVTVTQGTASNLHVTEASGTAILAKATTIAGAVSGSEMQVDLVGAMPSGTNTIGKVKLTDGSEDVAINASNQLEVNVNTASGLEVVQGTAGDLNVTEANSGTINTNIDNMMWSSGLEVTPNDSSDLSGAPYYAVYVGTGGTLRVNTAASAGGSDLELVNVASGSVIPLKVSRVYQTVSAGTVASGIVVFSTSSFGVSVLGVSGSFSIVWLIAPSNTASNVGAFSGADSCVGVLCSVILSSFIVYHFIPKFRFCRTGVIITTLPNIVFPLMFSYLRTTAYQRFVDWRHKFLYITHNLV